MASNFPSSLDSFTNPSSSDAMDSVSVPHASQHSDLNDAVEALQAKVGADSSAVATSLDYKIAQLESATTGKILQVVRATDTTTRTTTSTSYVDASISVTITPTSADSDVMLIWTANAFCSTGTIEFGYAQITDASNNSISGANDAEFGIASSADLYFPFTLIGFDSPATTSATTYKGRFRTHSTGGQLELRNSARLDGQLIALEISA